MAMKLPLWARTRCWLGDRSLLETYDLFPQQPSHAVWASHSIQYSIGTNSKITPQDTQAETSNPSHLRLGVFQRYSLRQTDSRVEELAPSPKSEMEGERHICLKNTGVFVHSCVTLPQTHSLSESKHLQLLHKRIKQDCFYSPHLLKVLSVWLTVNNDICIYVAIGPKNQIK